MTRSEQLADAMLAISKVNHYMVGLTETVTSDEIESARQILITRQNHGSQSGKLYRQLDLALDILESLDRKAVYRNGEVVRTRA